MTALRNHRVIIASLFLPNTAALGEDSNASTPVLTGSPRAPPPVLHLGDRLLAAKKHVPEAFQNRPGHSHKSSLDARPGIRRFDSIVDDLAGKTKANTTPLVGTPVNESVNPFASLRTLAVPPVARSNSGSNSPNGPHTSNNDSPLTPRQHHAPLRHRVSRKNSSRSSSRHPSESAQRELAAAHLWHIEANPHCNGGLKNAIQSVDDKLRKKLWVGALGSGTEAFEPDLKKSVARRLREECDSVPVWIPDAEFSKCYDEFCHQVLWPALHYAVPDAPKTKSFYESASFSQYVSVNQRFADAIVANYIEGDIIWVNDYHLMLLPSLVRAKLPNASIGFFLHVAFPSSEIFRCLSVRQTLLRGVLAADLIGFQTANFARHFRQTVSRILSLEALPKGIQTEERFVDVAVFPMGIDVAHLHAERSKPEVAEWVSLLNQRYAGMKMIVGRDKLDEVQGVRQKILAFERFLEQSPSYQSKVVLIQVALSTTEENEMQGGVADIVSRINSRFSTLTWQPVVFLHTQDLTFSQYLALLTVADAFIVTSLREGMALRTHEFVECQEERARPLILSEFTGSYSYSGFRSCIAINPWDSRNTAKAIHTALTMPADEARTRWEQLHNHVVTQTAQTFVTSFLTRCLRASMEHMRRELAVEVVPKLDVPRVLPKWRYARKRVLFLDYEGTLWVRSLARIREGSGTPEGEVLELLGKLSGERRNEVWLLSGLPVKALEAVTQAAPGVGLVAENGCFLKPSNGDWINLVANHNFAWKAPCVEILTYYTERTPGSFVEEREASIVWRFWTGDAAADPGGREWAHRQAAEAQNHIFDSLGERYGLRIIPGGSSFLVLPANVSRSTAVGAILAPNGSVRGWSASPVGSPRFGSPRSGGAGGFGGPSTPTARSWITARRNSSNSLMGLNTMALDALAADERDVTEDDNAEEEFVLAIGKDEKLLRRLNDLDNAETVSTSLEGTDAKWKLGAKESVGALWKFANVA